MVKKKKPSVPNVNSGSGVAASATAASSSVSDSIGSGWIGGWSSELNVTIPAPDSVSGYLVSTDDSMLDVVTTVGAAGNLSGTAGSSSTIQSGDMTVAGIGAQTPAVEEKREGVPIFKDPNFVHSTKSGQAANKKTRVWKNLKQITSAERMLPWAPNDVTYAMIDAPTSFKPAKKYSDITGLPAKYTDPQTRIRYATSEEFSRIRMMPADLVAGFLTLRKANAPVP